MAQGASAAMHIYFCMGHLVFVHSRHGYYGKGFVYFKRVYHFSSPASFFVQLFNRTNRKLESEVKEGRFTIA